MIAEAANFIATLAVSGRRSPSEINASVRLWARARRCVGDWAGHEAHSKSAVRDAMNRLTRFKTAVILGSGLLRDVPIEEIAARFETVVLVDLQHLATVRLWVWLKRLGNISYVERDVSGMDLLTHRPDGAYDALVDPLDFLNAFGEIDLLVSANMLSQMALGVSRALEAGQADQVAAVLIRSHIAALQKRASVSCLITDISYQIIDKAGKVHEICDLMHGLELSGTGDSWFWTVAPFGEIVPGHKAVHKVVSVLAVNPP